MKTKRVFCKAWLAGIAIALTACSPSTNGLLQGTRLPALPVDLSRPCAELSTLDGTTAQSNYLWAIDTIDKYNRCAAMKDAVTEIYQNAEKRND